jgi:PAS domain S-box-containing protein
VVVDVNVRYAHGMTGLQNFPVSTELNAVERALWQREEQLRLATDAAEVGLWDVDLTADTLFWPARVKAMFGISPHVAVTMGDFYSGLHPDDKERVGAAFALALDARARAVYDVEYRTIGKEDGKIRWVAAKGRGIFDDKGACTRVIGTAIDITDRKRGDEAVQRLAAIVEWSDDAIIMKDLEGIIASWNRGAERIFGYSAAEMIGMPITLLAPEARKNEEPIILARILEGKTIDHYETVRRCKDGRLIDVSLTVSPVRGTDGKIIGASKIARDIGNEKRSREQRDLILREMDHRIKNLFALASGVVSLSIRSASTPKELAHIVGERLAALARAHALTLTNPSQDNTGQSAMLHALIATIVSAYDGTTEDGKPRISILGANIAISGEAVTSLALLLHEFATNAAKYGALSVPDGNLEITSSEVDGKVHLLWQERGGPRIDHQVNDEGFGSALARMTITGQLGGQIDRDWQPDGLSIQLIMDRARLTGGSGSLGR